MMKNHSIGNLYQSLSYTNSYLVICIPISTPVMHVATIPEVADKNLNTVLTAYSLSEYIFVFPFAAIYNPRTTIASTPDTVRIVYSQI